MIVHHADQAEIVRSSRLRRTGSLRKVARETRLHPADLVEPIFVVERESDAGEIDAMPGVCRESLESLPRRTQAIRSSGVQSVLLFGVPATKDDAASSAMDELGVVPRAIRLIKQSTPDLVVITDVCLCQYTSHGHCGLIDREGIHLESSLDALAATAVAHAQAGADIVAPSAMLDGTVASIRCELDRSEAPQVAILAYAIKHASAFYGPFREAADSTPAFGDRRSHQIDPANAREALREAQQDIQEGADALLIKPGMPCLDLIYRASEIASGRPVGAYQVSGEYSMIEAAATRGWLDHESAALESLLAIKRAGADFIITYWASRAAQWIREGRSES